MDRIEISALLDIYGSLLNERQRSMLELYCDEDLSLSEISENVGITRQGVRDAIARAANNLTEIEEKLGIAEKTRIIALLAEDIIKTSSEKSVREFADRILKII